MLSVGRVRAVAPAAVQTASAMRSAIAAISVARQRTALPARSLHRAPAFQHRTTARWRASAVSSVARWPVGARLFSAASGPTPPTPAKPDSAVVPAADTTPATTTPAAQQTWREKGAVLWAKAKAEGRHYWLGTKLLWADIKIATRLCRAIANGHEMTRRERKQLMRTSADLVRMVPFLVILVVPFAEFALPILLKFFPNMLPSQYLDSTGNEAKLQKQLLVKMEMARFLQETTLHLAQQLAQQKGGVSSEDSLTTAKKFRDFMEKVRTGGKVLNADIVGFSKLFDSELTLENLNKEQLAAMCRMLDIKVFGSVWVLRYKLQEKLRQIQKDDELIQKEGVDSLSEAELKVACIERGIYTGPEKDVSYLKRKLQDWLELSLMHQVPVTLLLLSRAFSRQMVGAGHIKEAEGDALTSDLATTLAHVPHVVVEEAAQGIVDLTDDAATKLKSIEEEAVEAAYEEIKARKDGMADKETRASKINKVKTAVGVTQEKLAKLTEANVKTGTLIDRTVESEHAQEAKAKEAAPAAAAAAAVAAPAPPAAAAAAVEPKPATVAPAAAVEVAVAPVAPAAVAAAPAAVSKKKETKEKKTIAVVDKLNDRVGAILEEIKEHTRMLEELQRERQRLEKEAAAATEAAAPKATAATTAAADSKAK